MKVIANKEYKKTYGAPIQKQAFLLTPDLQEKLFGISDLIKAPNDITALAYAIELTLQLMLAMGENGKLTVTIQHPLWRKKENA